MRNRDEYDISCMGLDVRSDPNQCNMKKMLGNGAGFRCWIIRPSCSSTSSVRIRPSQISNPTVKTTVLPRACGQCLGRPAWPTGHLFDDRPICTYHIGVNLPKYRVTFQNFRGSSQNFRTFGGLFHGFGYLTPVHGLNHSNGRNFRPARPTPDLVVGHKL